MFFILSLLVSSVAACACSHHQPKAEAEASSCHSHSADEADSKKGKSETLKNAGPVISPGECCCVQPAPRAIAKSEKVKSEAKGISAWLPSVDAVFVLKSVGGPPSPVEPLFLTAPFLNLTPGRAPPRL